MKILVALPLIAWLGFAAGPHNDPTALEGLKTVFALGPALAHIIATLIIWRFPLDEAAHAEIRRALDVERVGCDLPLPARSEL